VTRRFGWKQLVLMVIAVAISFGIANYELWLPWHWKPYESPDHAFSIAFPGVPQISESEVKTGSGSAKMTSLAVAPSGRVAYTCLYFDVSGSKNPKEDSQLIDAMIQGGLEKAKGTILKQEEFDQGGSISRRVLAKVRGDSTMDIQISLASGRAYMLAVVSNPEARNERNIYHFFNSFKAGASAGAKNE
jgi:hypothetical protein